MGEEKGKDFVYFFASRQVKILFCFTNNINVLAAAYISLHDPQRRKELSVTVCSALYLLICSSSAYRRSFDSYCFCKSVPLNLDQGHENANYFYVDSSLLI